MIRPVRALPFAIVAIATISCATAGPKKQDPRVAERETRTRALVAEVAKQRGLAELKPLDISFEDAATFRASIQRAADDDKSDPEVERAKWVAFGFAPPDADPQEIARKVLDEQVAAFYDPKEKKLHVPLDPPAGAGGTAENEAEVVLAHEIEHGLQDEHYPIPDLDQQSDDDTALALKALYEGDATFVMVAVPLSRQGPVDGARLLQVARQLRSLPISTLESMSGKQSPELEKAPKIVRDELLLPYFGGMLLMAELYRVGGYALIDKLFEHPAVSTEQILHPEKYVAGELPVLVDAPALPAGMKELARGRLGELGVRTLFSDCLDDGASAKAAEGWGGDAYLIAAKPDGAMELFWSTTWDSEEAAQRFDAAIAKAGTKWCFSAVQPTAKSNWTLGDGASEQRSGRSVAVVRGLSETESRDALAKLLLLPHAPLPNAPPLGDVKLAPPEPKPGDDASAASSDPLQLPAHPPGTVANGVWSSDWHGLRSKLPDGFVPSTDAPGAELTLHEEGGESIGQLVALFASSSEAEGMRKMLVGGVLGGMAHALGDNAKPQASEPREKRVDGTRGEEIEITAPGTPIDMKMLFWERCGGRVLYVITLAAATPEGAAKLSGWVDSMKTDDADAPVCHAALPK